MTRLSHIGLLISHQLTTKNRLKSLLQKVSRLLMVGLSFKEHQAIVKTIARPQTRQILHIFPQVVFRYTAPYLSEKITLKRRRDMLKGHYAFLNDAFSSDFFPTVINEHLCLWGALIEGKFISIQLSGPCLITKNREGDLTATVEYEGRIACKIGFSIVPISTLPPLPASGQNAASHMLFVGQVQGQLREFELIKEVTKLCQDISPLDLLMSAVEGFSAALGADFVVGVSQANNVSFNDEALAVANSHFNYSEFWHRYNGVENSDGDFWIRMPLEAKPIHLIAANHRGRTLRKRAFKQQVSEQTRSVIEGYMLGHAKAPDWAPAEEMAR